jgi:hypothetical protein
LGFYTIITKYIREDKITIFIAWYLSALNRLVFLDSILKVMQELIYYLKTNKKKRNESFLHQRRNKEIYKLPYIEDFEANAEVSEDKILCKLEHTM